ncbi:hypothetical protein JXI42_08050 [bacterium]|nr:hypothetical protein [bacterium]
MINKTEKLIVITILFLLLPGLTILNSEPWKFSGDLEYSFEYDDNLFNLSEEDLRAVDEGDESFKLETPDDFISSPKLFLKAKSRLLGTVFSIGNTFRYSMHLNNQEKNYLYIRPRIKFTKYYITFTFAYTYIPEYTLRTYYDTDQPYGTDHYPWCTYALNRFTWQLNGKIWKRIEGRFRTDYELLYYNEDFLEYDSKALEFEQALGYSSDIEFWAGLTYRKSDAQGIDTEGEDKLTSDDSDISYKEFQYNFSVTHNRIKIFNRDLSIGIDLKIYNREYTTEKPGIDDPYHTSREESRIVARQFIEFDLVKNLTLNLSYEYTERESESTVFPEIAELKNYAKNSISLSFDYNINEFELW